jgi:tetratricopeptide (TPR) repeat protein
LVGLTAVAIAFAGLTWLTFWVSSQRRYNNELARAEREIELGRYEAAQPRLARLSAGWPGQAEVEYFLGHCEHALSHFDDALAAWARIPPGSPFADLAALPRARVLIVERGQFTAAEDILKPAIGRRKPSARDARETLARLYFWEGRLDEMRRLLEDGWSQAPNRAEALRELWKLDTDPLPTEAITAALDRAEKKAPDDDRTWLARANLATRSGRFDDALRWFDACTRKRPDDPVIWRARLDWSVSSDHLDECRRSLSHLPAERLSATEILGLQAWVATHQGLPDVRRNALESLLEHEPANTQALEGLAALAREAGRSEEAASYRSAKAAIDRAKERYHDLLVDPVAPEHIEELARLAGTLGRRFDARGWWTLLVVSHPENPEFRAALDQASASADRQLETRGVTLAGLRTELARMVGTEGPSGATQVRTAALPETRPSFRDDAVAARLSSFVFENGATGLHQLPETASGGVGLIDYDGDGWLDVYLVQGGPFPPESGRPGSGDKLFRNRGDGTFEDMTAPSGIASFSRGYGHGVAVGDFDNDGRPDLFVTRWRAYALYRNRGDGTFEDVTAQAGLSGDRDWPTSAAFADLDGDGDLDLYVCHYLEWDAVSPRACWDEVTKANVACRPRDFRALPDHVFRNEGGRFVDVTVEAGVVDRDGRGLGVVAADLDDDGRVDLYVANDTTANFLFRNLGGFRFEETAEAAGASANANGGYQAGMGVACGDLDGDGRLDLGVTNFFNESTTFYQNLGRGRFVDRTAAVGLAGPSRYLLGFGIAFLDVDNDGKLDLMTANGHVSDLRPRSPFAMPAQLLMGRASGRLTDVSGVSGPPFLVPHVGRGLAVGDLDNDGRLDAILVAQNEPPVYFHNQTEAGHFLTIELEGARSNRDAIGARVTLVRGACRRVAERTGGGSYQSSSDPRLHFGLGASDGVVSVEVRWPSGRIDRYDGLAVDRGYRLREGDVSARPMAGFAGRPRTGPGLRPLRRPW